MWPLSIVLLFATAGPQQKAPAPGEAYVGKIPQLRNLVQRKLQMRRLSPDEIKDRNTCYTIRSYHFERQDGQAPVLAGMTTCTPSRILEQKQVSPGRGLYVPLVFSGEQRQPE
ncbi:MAG TPA: hypothetical protein VFR84_10880 [Candidatus Angelobacter sp.]|nr:hypothetical protein [Candidatus Angelobacter sp.]